MTLGVIPSPGIPNYGDRALRTSYATLLPPGARIAAFVRSGGYVETDPVRPNEVLTSIADALPMVRAGYGDVIVCLPGHDESLTDATLLANLRAGTRILGLGVGSNQAKLTFDSTTAQLTLDQVDCVIEGMRLEAGADGVVLGIDITAAGCQLIGNTIIAASAAAVKFTTICHVSAGDVKIIGNKVLGTATHNITDGFVLDTAADGIEITDNFICASATAGNGFVAVDAAVTNVFIARNRMNNTHTASTCCIGVADVASSGIICDNYVATVNDGVAAAQGVVFAGATTTTIKPFQNYSSDEPAQSGVLGPAVLDT